jgi:hypothetical protein
MLPGNLVAEDGASDLAQHGDSFLKTCVPAKRPEPRFVPNMNSWSAFPTAGGKSRQLAVPLPAGSLKLAENRNWHGS